TIHSRAPDRLTSLHMDLKPVPPSHASHGLPSPIPKGPMLTDTGNMTHGNGRGILQHDGIIPLGLPITIEPQGEQSAQLNPVAIGGVPELTLSPQGGEFLAMIRLEVEVEFGLVAEATPCPPDHDRHHFRGTEHGRPAPGMRREALGLQWGVQGLRIIINTDVKLKYRL